MSWIGSTDKHRSFFNLNGLGAPKPVVPHGPHDILSTGTLVVETLFEAGPEADQAVLRYDRFKEWRRHLEISLTSDGSMVVRLEQGPGCFEAKLAFPVPEQDATIRLYYSWNGPERWSRLAVKMVETGAFYVAYMDDPLPMPVLDALTMMRNGKATKISPATAFVAVSDEVESVGLQAGVVAGTLVETPSGAVPVERLRLGDHVLTAEAGAQPVRWITRRKVPALGAFRPVRLRAPYMGLTKDLLLAPDHRIRVGGEEAEYMLGRDDILLAAGRLVGSHAAIAETKAKTVTYYHVLLDHHECLLHDGVWAESLFVGQIAADPKRLRATALAEMPTTAVPRHRRMSQPILSEAEARSLAAVLHR